jgi:hypothetical protein
MTLQLSERQPQIKNLNHLSRPAPPAPVNNFRWTTGRDRSKFSPRSEQFHLRLGRSARFFSGVPYPHLLDELATGSVLNDRKLQSETE